MRRVTCSISITLDGYIADADGSFEWGAPNEAVFDHYLAELRNTGTQLLGRKLYETMLYWENAGQEQSLSPAESEWARLWKRLPKVVYSRTLTTVQGNARLATHSVADEIARLRSESSDSDIAIGGATLAGAAAELGLIDEYRVTVHPVLVGGGIPLFPRTARHVGLELVENLTFGQLVQLRYRVQH